MFRFESPQYLFALLLVVIIFILSRWIGVKRFNILKNLFKEQSKIDFLLTYSIPKVNRKILLSCLALMFFIISWSRPQMGKGQGTIKSEGVEILLAIDVSQSMLAEDVRPSRLDLVKNEVNKFIDILGGDKVGLLVFAGSSLLISPLTSDKSALKMYIEGLSTDSVENQGTEIKKALNESMEALVRGGSESDEKSKVTKVVILISDGEDHDQGAVEEAKKLTENGIRVFTVAVGTESGGKIAVRDPRGALRGYLKGPDGNAVETKVNVSALKEIAQAGKGGFYHLNFTGKQMELLKEDIAKLEHAEFDSIVSQRFDEKYQWPLLVGLALALLELYLGNRKKISDQWKGRFHA